MIDSNTKQLILQEFDSIGLSLLSSTENDDYIEYKFKHREILVKMKIAGIKCDVTQITDIEIDGKACELHFVANDCYRRHGNLKQYFDEFVSNLNKEIMKLDRIEVNND